MYRKIGMTATLIANGQCRISGIDISRPTTHTSPMSRPKKKTYPSEARATKSPIRNFPSQAATEGVIDLTPALTEADMAEIKQVLATATPEQFQQCLAGVLRKMLVTGLKDIPAPKSIKEMEVVFNMVRKAEGIEARERGHGVPPAGFLPRVVGRKAIPTFEAEVLPTEDPGSGDTLFPEEDPPENKFEI